MENAFLLIIKDGKNYIYNKTPIYKPIFRIGRFNSKNNLDISLNSKYISKNHLILHKIYDKYYIEDCNSKHGTVLNEKKLIPTKMYNIKNEDKLKLAKEEVIIIFKIGLDDIDTPDIMSNKVNLLFMDNERKEVFIGNTRIRLTLKLYDLCELLYINKNKIVSHDEIRYKVWKDREKDSKSIPLVTNYEIKQLVVRLRKKLGVYGSMVINVRGEGYMIEN